MTYSPVLVCHTNVRTFEDNCSKGFKVPYAISVVYLIVQKHCVLTTMYDMSCLMHCLLNTALIK